MASLENSSSADLAYRVRSDLRCDPLIRIKIQAPATDQIARGRPGWRHSPFAPEPREIIEHRGDGGLARPPFVLRGRTKSAPSVLIVSRRVHPRLSGAHFRLARKPLPRGSPDS